MATLIKIGNSQGVRIPKAIIEQAHLEDNELNFKVVEDGLLIQPVKKVRAGWKEQFDKALQIHSPNPEDQDWLEAPLTENIELEW